MMKQIKIALPFTALATLGLGILYPLITSAISLLIPSWSSPSLLLPTHKDIFFQGRPSLSGGSHSGASNLSLTSLELQKRVRERLAHLTADSPQTLVPPDLLFASASGYDPDISLEAALFQASRVARVNNIDEKEVKKLIERHTQPKLLGFIGAQKVDVAKLNDNLKRRVAKE